MKIGIVGCGTVGGALAKVFSRSPGLLVQTYDRDTAKPSTAESLYQLLHWSDLNFVCLPTPPRPSGSGYDLAVLERFFQMRTGDAELEAVLRDQCFVLKSTVPIGTCEQLAKDYLLTNLVHSPEFLTARTAEQDAAAPRLNLVGRTLGKDSQCADRLHQLYDRVWPEVNCVMMESKETEAVKLVMNSFFAVKVAFFNEAQQLLSKLGCSYYDVVTAMIMEGRVSKLHTQVPGPDGHYGFGGACLPKDLQAFMVQCLEHGLDGRVAAAAMTRNLHDRKRMV